MVEKMGGEEEVGFGSARREKAAKGGDKQPRGTSSSQPAGGKKALRGNCWLAGTLAPSDGIRVWDP